MLGLREIDRWFIDRVLPHERRYVALARRFSSNGEEAADLVQDVYARVMTSESWRFVEEPRAYVLTMIRNLGIQKLRRSRVVPMQSLTELETTRHASDTPDAFDETSGRQRLRLALDALQALPPRCREVVELRRLHDLPSRDIARRLGLSLSTVEKRLARGMTLMALTMSQVEGQVEDQTATTQTKSGSRSSLGSRKAGAR